MRNGTILCCSTKNVRWLKIRDEGKERSTEGVSNLSKGKEYFTERNILQRRYLPHTYLDSLSQTEAFFFLSFLLLYVVPRSIFFFFFFHFSPPLLAYPSLPLLCVWQENLLVRSHHRERLPHNSSSRTTRKYYYSFVLFQLWRHWTYQVKEVLKL